MTETAEASRELADKMQRLRAALIDGLLFTVPYALVKADFGDFLTLFGVLLMVVLTVAQFWLLSSRGQTVGKAVVNIRIVLASDGENGGFFTNVIKRTVFTGLLDLIPFYLLVDSAMIFRQDRRCLHDLIAGTRVVKG